MRLQLGSELPQGGFETWAPPDPLSLVVATVVVVVVVVALGFCSKGNRDFLHPPKSPSPLILRVWPSMVMWSAESKGAQGSRREWRWVVVVT